MVKIMFVCYGNICRSPMAEFLLKDKVKKLGLEDEFIINSSATSTEELGNGVHYGTRQVLDRLKISYAGKYSVRLKQADYENYDFFIGMDENNRRTMNRMLGGDPLGKISLLMDYTKRPRDVADPYWTGNFKDTYDDIEEGLNEFLRYLQKHGYIRKTI